MSKKYDHVSEAARHYANASELRRKAHVVREEAEKKAHALEREAEREVCRGLHVHRLCTSGSAFVCCCPPEVVAALAHVGVGLADP